MTDKDPTSPDIEKLLREAFVHPPSDDVRARHLAAMAEAFGEAPSAGVSGRKRRRTGLVARAAALAAGVVIVSGGALAATGGLPDGAQNAVANAVRPVVNLPGGDDEAEPASRPESAEEGQARAEHNRSEAEEYTEAKQAWTDCVAAEAPEHERATPFDPEDACGPKPTRAPAAEVPSRQQEPESEETSPPGKGLEQAPGQNQGGKTAEHGPPSPGPVEDPGRRPESAGRRP